jgi:hypothetical protein
MDENGDSEGNCSDSECSGWVLPLLRIERLVNYRKFWLSKVKLDKNLMEISLLD